ncbi:MAG: metallophosphoesterase [Anaerolineae bacterium]
MSNQFRVAILADIHGNSHALKAVLADIEEQSPDLVVFGGDLASKGPNPAECVDLVRNSGHPGIVGNTDLDILNKSGAEEAWMREQLGEDRLNFLQSLPMQKRISPPGRQNHLDDLLIVHSTPRSCYDLLILAPKPNSTDAFFIQPTSAKEAARMLAGAKANLIVYGHIHFISRGTIKGRRVESIGAVGFPFDLDHRAAYAIAQWDRDKREWKLEHRRVSYEVEKTIADMEQSTHPYPERSIRMLRDAQWYKGNPKKTRV